MSKETNSQLCALVVDGTGTVSDIRNIPIKLWSGRFRTLLNSDLPATDLRHAFHGRPR
jgi:hypothetical protein